MSNSSHLNVPRLVTWLSSRLPEFQGPIEIKKFPGGQSNPTFCLISPRGTYVLRQKPKGVLLKSAHAIDREFRVQRALQGSDVPVATMLLFCEDEKIIGSMFYVMEMINGRNFEDPRLPEISLLERKSFITEMNRVLAAIHNLNIKKIGLSDFGPDGNYYRRQTDRWIKQYRSTESQYIPEMEELISWVDKNIPSEDGQRTLVHGDYRIDNMIFSKTGPECLALLDWELATLGHPYADLANVIMQWSMPYGPEGRGLGGVNRKSQGLMEDQEFIDTYCSLRKIGKIENFGFYLAFCFFRMAGILQGVKKRALEGNASNPERGLKMGRFVPKLAQAGLEAAKES